MKSICSIVRVKENGMGKVSDTKFCVRSQTVKVTKLKNTFNVCVHALLGRNPSCMMVLSLLDYAYLRFKLTRHGVSSE